LPKQLKQQSRVRSSQLSTGLHGECRALGWGVSRHWRDLFQLQACNEHGRGRNAPPAVEFPTGPKEFDLRAQGDVEDHLGGATIELLGELQERAFAESPAVGGAPDGDFEGFLLDLFGDSERAKEGAGNGFGNVERRAVAARFEPGVGGDKSEFEGHGGVAFLIQRECNTWHGKGWTWVLLQTPGRALWPVAHCFGGPGGGFVFVTVGAGIGDLVFVGHVGRDEGEGVGADFHIGDGGGDSGHVAGDAAAAGGTFFVVGVLFDRGGARAVERERAVAVEADLVAGLAELRVILGAVNVVTAEAGDAAAVHHALHEVISLHAVFVGGAIGEMREGGFAEFVFFELPVIAEI
jgi:hypothetical protein